MKGRKPLVRDVYKNFILFPGDCVLLDIIPGLLYKSLAGIMTLTL